nr:MAG TPA: hypothetical protein [Caudoviricetes sp.]
MSTTFSKKLSLKQKKTRVMHAERNPCSMDDRLGFSSRSIISIS